MISWRGGKKPHWPEKLNACWAPDEGIQYDTLNQRGLFCAYLQIYKHWRGILLVNPKRFQLRKDINFESHLIDPFNIIKTGVRKKENDSLFSLITEQN